MMYPPYTHRCVSVVDRIRCALTAIINNTVAESDALHTAIEEEGLLDDIYVESHHRRQLHTAVTVPRCVCVCVCVCHANFSQHLSFSLSLTLCFFFMGLVLLSSTRIQ